MVDNYRIVIHGSWVETEQEVHRLMKLGFQPQGGVTRAEGKFYQAMVRYHG